MAEARERVPLLASFEPLPWLRITPSFGLSGAVGYLHRTRGFGTATPMLEALYVRVGGGIEFHHAWFSVQPEITYLRTVTTLELGAVFTGMAFNFGAIP